jgi:hypothetical protein
MYVDVLNKMLNRAIQSARTHNVRLVVVLEIRTPLHDWQLDVWIEYSVETPEKMCFDLKRSTSVKLCHNTGYNS